MPDPRVVKILKKETYPTYQFHSFVSSDRMKPDEVFRRLVYMFVYWVYQRMKQSDCYNELSDDIKSILEPARETAEDKENKISFAGREYPADKLASFSSDGSVQLECVYLKTDGSDKEQPLEVWSLKLSETHSGLTDRDGNITEKAVPGRTLDTELSVRRHETCVEFGTRTMVTEPVTPKAPRCTVIRPAYIRYIFEDPELKFFHRSVIYDNVSPDLLYYDNIYDDIYYDIYDEYSEEQAEEYEQYLAENEDLLDYPIDENDFITYGKDIRLPYRMSRDEGSNNKKRTTVDFNISKKEYIINDQEKLKTLSVLLTDDYLDLPILIAADSGYTEDSDGADGSNGDEDTPDTAKTEELTFFSGGTDNTSFGAIRRSASFSVLGGQKLPDITFEKSINKNNRQISVKVIHKKSKDKHKKPVRPERVKQEPFNFTYFMSKYFGYVIPVFIPEKYIGEFNKMTSFDLNSNEALILKRGVVYRVYNYNETDIQKLSDSAEELLRTLISWEDSDFGDTMFCSRARRFELDLAFSSASTAEEKINALKRENEQLKKDLIGYKQRNTASQEQKKSFAQISSDINKAKKEIEGLRNENEKLSETIASEQFKLNKANKDFDLMKELYDTAISFPTRREDICKWAEDRFGDTIILIESSLNESMNGYTGSLDITATACFALCYLDAAAHARTCGADDPDKEKWETTADWYAQKGEFNVKRGNDGKLQYWIKNDVGRSATARTTKQDYLFRNGNDVYSLTDHLKKGNQNGDLIRIYFNWEDDIKKYVVGHIGDHLRTVSYT